jgi:hypothetical protein
MDRETRRHYDTLVFSEPRYAFLIITERPKDVLSGLESIVDAEIYTEGNRVFFVDAEDDARIDQTERYLESAEGIEYVKILRSGADFLPQDKDILLKRLSMFTKYSIL